MFFNLAANKIGDFLLGLGSMMKKYMYQMTGTNSKMRFALLIYGSGRNVMLPKP
jgi:hypothetical protein